MQMGKIAKVLKEIRWVTSVKYDDIELLSYHCPEVTDLLQLLHIRIWNSAPGGYCILMLLRKFSHGYFRLLRLVPLVIDWMDENEHTIFSTAAYALINSIFCEFVQLRNKGCLNEACLLKLEPWCKIKAKTLYNKPHFLRHECIKVVTSFYQLKRHVCT